MSNGSLMALWSVVTMSAVIFLMWLSGTFLPAQMGRVSLPGIANGSIIANLVLMSAVLYFIGQYSDQWSKTDITMWQYVGMLVSWLLYWYVYRHGKYDDGLTHPLSLAGIIFLIYGGAMYTAIGLFYFRTTATLTDIAIVGALLLLYVPVANHAVLGWLNSWSYFNWTSWCPRLFAEESSPAYFILGGDLLVVIATVLKLNIR